MLLSCYLSIDLYCIKIWFVDQWPSVYTSIICVPFSKRVISKSKIIENFINSLSPSASCLSVFLSTQSYKFVFQFIWEFIWILVEFEWQTKIQDKDSNIHEKSSPNIIEFKHSGHSNLIWNLTILTLLWSFIEWSP